MIVKALLIKYLFFLIYVKDLKSSGWLKSGIEIIESNLAIQINTFSAPMQNAFCHAKWITEELQNASNSSQLSQDFNKPHNSSWAVVFDFIFYHRMKTLQNSVPFPTLYGFATIDTLSIQCDLTKDPFSQHP